MATFTISKWFAVEADSFEEAWEMADGCAVELAQNADESGTIDVECMDEDFEDAGEDCEEDEGYDDDTHGVDHE